MSKTNKDNDRVKVRHFQKKLRLQVKDDLLVAPVGRPVRITLSKKCIKANTGIVISEDELINAPYKGWKREHEHSAAHRHSAIKTRTRCNRKKKHSENHEVKQQIKKDLCQE